MKNKTGNFTIFSGKNMAFTSEEVFFHSFSDIETSAAEKLIKDGQLNGRKFADYTEFLTDDISIKVKDRVVFKFYHTWANSNPNAVNVGSDSIVVNETRIIKVFKNGEELKVNAERFVTDFFAHIDHDGVFDGFAFSTWYYHDSSNYRVLLKEHAYKPMIQVVRKYAQEVAKYKRNNMRCSPIQIKANKNREDNKDTSDILTTSTALGTIVSQIPHPYAKYGGKAIAGISKGLNPIMTKSEHADEIAIMFKLEYEK